MKIDLHFEEVTGYFVLFLLLFFGVSKCKLCFDEGVVVELVSDEHSHDYN